MIPEFHPWQYLLAQPASTRYWEQGGDGDWAEVLATLPIFSGVAKRHLRELVRDATFAEFTPGDTVLAKGDPAHSVFVILGGSAKALGTPAGRKLGTGEVFGELAVLDGGPRTRTVVATTNLHVMRVPRESFLRLTRRHPAIPLAMLRGLSADFRRLETQLAAA